MEPNAPMPVIVILSFVVIVWIFIWKGVALWTAAKHNQMKWFIGLTVATFPLIMYNALGIIDITYLFFFAKKKLTIQDIKSWKNIFYKKELIHKREPKKN